MEEYNEEKVRQKIQELSEAADLLSAKRAEIQQLRYRLMGLLPMIHTDRGEDGKPVEVREERINGHTKKPWTKQEKDEIIKANMPEVTKKLTEVTKFNAKSR